MPKNRLTFHTVRELDGELEQAMQLFVETFKTETITALTYNFTKQSTTKLFYEASLLNAKVYLAQGNDIIIAKIDKEIVGVASIKKEGKISFIHLLKIIFPEAFKLLPLLSKIRYKNATALAKSMRLSKPIQEKSITLSTIAVSANYRGKGIGKQFLNEIHQYYKKDFAAVYLYTADKKNKEIYSRAGYKLIEHKQMKKYDMYHMLYLLK
ncbi:hypothetical protein GCM10025886_17320 [Tetragenococcus halophilus subsp. flandriensis]|uniref:GNAT family N-acetyltransferase n=1 Tax=Tetragenococcus halophilus TaxID=51669 RepID=UPI0023EA39DA|nr:GNAT family N-acetyltransferase [Tetragenococcus halophilus]GMA08581.1 hypothetical protein GCM10025886_17320 [Tetragenococcus halophilus subsp. flandriensis]